ncbi:DNA-processing protein DprA [Arenibaculum pallidiluteum]|uniref:DNA-processing protein DprA n=1 Tax=Arenibaculum pallidiluteum TaxID=2812559 RepID=UPI001A972CE4|nr:DNA-processing protein DprA [Arenibaculum pallidiluteum]
MMQPTRVLPEGERIDWLRLIRSENVGPVTFHKLIERYGTAAAALDALPGLARRGGRASLRIASRSEAERELAAAARIGAVALASCEPAFPRPLAAIEDCPPLIFVRGDAALLGRPSVAVVGARNASANGRRFAEALARDLGRAGWVVVSGLARGIDASAHLGAIETGTVAVLAGGPDSIYPEENRALQARIAEAGALVAEMPVGLSPQARHFPRRNRIVSGLSRGIAVVEATPGSGSLITARLALDQGREVFAVPGSPLDPRARGTNDLIRQGATLTEGADDVLRVLEAQGGLAEPGPAEFAAGTQGRGRQGSPGGDPEREAGSRRAAFLELLGPSPVPVDELVRGCQLSPPAAQILLLELEIAGHIQRLPGNRVVLIRPIP